MKRLNLQPKTQLVLLLLLATIVSCVPVDSHPAKKSIVSVESMIQSRTAQRFLYQDDDSSSSSSSSDDGEEEEEEGEDYTTVRRQSEEVEEDKETTRRHSSETTEKSVPVPAAHRDDSEGSDNDEDSEDKKHSEQKSSNKRDYQEGTRDYNPTLNRNQGPDQGVTTNNDNYGYSQQQEQQQSSQALSSSSSTSSSALNFSPQDTESFNKFSMTACQKIDMAIKFITSLDFEEHFQKTLKYYAKEEDATTTSTSRKESEKMHSEESKFYTEVYLLQMVFLPFSILMLLFGCSFFYPTCILCAATIGLLGVFDLVEKLLRFHLDCPMKLALSVVAAFLCAVLAVSFFRFGLFCFGSVCVGGTVYLLMDSFPQYLDPGVVVFDPTAATGAAVKSSDVIQSVSNDLSASAWIIIVLFSIMGGMLLRYYEQATLELMTAGIGGIGCSYSIHTFFLVRGKVLDPAIVFLLAFFLAMAGWRFQRYRRLRSHQYQRLEMMGTGDHLPSTNQDSAAWMASQQQQQIQLQRSMQSLLHVQGNGSNQEGAPSSEQISELTNSINRFLEVMEKGGNTGKKNDKDS